MCWVSVHCLKFQWLNICSFHYLEVCQLCNITEEDDKGTSQTVMEKM